MPHLNATYRYQSITEIKGKGYAYNACSYICGILRKKQGVFNLSVFFFCAHDALIETNKKNQSAFFIVKNIFSTLLYSQISNQQT